MVNLKRLVSDSWMLLFECSLECVKYSQYWLGQPQIEFLIVVTIFRYYSNGSEMHTKPNFLFNRLVTLVLRVVNAYIEHICLIWLAAIVVFENEWRGCEFVE